MSGGTSQQFCVRWNSHLGSLGAAFPQLLAGQRFVDVTLACEGHQVHCHRLVLAACSTYFESLLGENPCKHPIIILPRDIKLWEIQALVDFMYKGEVNVSQAGLPDLLKCAETLQIRGLCGSDAALNLNHITNNSGSGGSAGCNSNSSTSSGPAAAAAGPSSSILPTSTNHLVHNMPNSSGTATATPTSATATSAPTSTTTHPIATTRASGSMTAFSTTSSSSSTSTSTGGHATKLVIGTVKRVAGLDVSSTSTQQHTAAITNILRTELLSSFKLQPTTASTTLTSNEGCTTGATGKTPSLSAALSLDDGDDSANGSSTELNIKSEEIDDMDIKMRHHEYGYDLDGSGKLQEENDQQTSIHNRSHQREPHHHHLHHDRDEITSTPPRLTVELRPSHHDTVIVPINNSCASNTPTSNGGGDGGDGCGVTATTGTIRVKSIENLFENYKRHHPPPPTNTTSISSITIDDKHTAIDSEVFASDDIVRPSRYRNVYTNKRLRIGGAEPSVGYDASASTADDQLLLPKSLRFNKNTMAIYVKNAPNGDTISTTPPTLLHNRRADVLQSNVRGSNELLQIDDDDNFENIICSPNFLQIPYLEDIDAEEDDDDDDGVAIIGCDDDDDAAAAAMAAAEEDAASEPYTLITGDDEDDDDDDDDIDMAVRNAILDAGSVDGHSLPRLIPFSLMQGGGNAQNENTNRLNLQNLMHTATATSTSAHHQLLIGSQHQLQQHNVGDGGVHQLYGGHHASHMRQMRFNMQMKLEADGASRMTSSSSGGGGQLRLNLHKKLGGMDGGSIAGRASTSTAIMNGTRPAPPPSAVVLRNPRGNQPRTYSTDELYAALMDVKSGESIYRASQMHKVPRKTLRNWMKRWDIKSAYPMPRQLKQAAENKKKNKINQTIQTLMSTGN